MSTFWLTREEVRELDRRAFEEFGVPGLVLMENAGRGCAELLMRLNPERKPVALLCGPGNNGGDGYVMARHLDNHGWPVSILAYEARAKNTTDSSGGVKTVTLGFRFDGLPPDAHANFEIASRSHLELFPLSQSFLWEGTRNVLADRLLKADCWIVDSLFGTGLSRALSSPFDDLIAIVNASKNPVFAVDLPSGLDADTGEPLGPTIRALYTATFVAMKCGFLNANSKQWTGAVHVVDIGAPRVLVDDYRHRPR